MTTENRRRTRGWILQLLALEPVEASGDRAQVTGDGLQRRLFDAGLALGIESLREEIAYLKGKGYIAVEQFKGIAAKIMGGPATGIRLSPSGQDIVDRTSVDAGVDLGGL